MRVDALIVNYLSGSSTRSAVSAVSGPAVQVHVWDNSGELLADPEMAVHGNGVNEYFARPNNVLYAQTSAPFVLLLNPDVVLRYSDLLRLREHLASHPDRWGVAPRLLWPDGRDQNYLRRLPDKWDLLLEITPPLRHILRSRWRMYRCLDLNLRTEQPVEQPPAACLLLRREAVGHVLFDETFPLFFNDVDLCRRLGPSCDYLPNVTATHVAGGSVVAARRTGMPIGAMYDDALLRYASLHTGGLMPIRLVLMLRRLARLDALKKLRYRRTAPQHVKIRPGR